MMSSINQKLAMAAILSLGAITGLETITVSSAQEPVVPPTAPGKIQTTNSDQALRNTTAVDAADQKVSGASVRVSQIIGMDIQNPAGEDIGEIDDMVLDPKTGRIMYAAVTYGGFLGLGNKLFAVPFEAFRFQRETGDDDDVVLILNIREEQLEASQGFDKDHWPNMSDPTFVRELKLRYGVDRPRAENDGVDVQIGGGAGVDIDID